MVYRWQFLKIADHVSYLNWRIAMTRSIIETAQAPAAIGTYSQAVKQGNTVYLSGQIPLHPATMEVVEGGFEAQARRVFENLKAVAQAAGGGMQHFVKINIYLTDLSHFAIVNQVMAEYFTAPYPARAAVEVSALPRASLIEIEGVMILD